MHHHDVFTASFYKFSKFSKVVRVEVSRAWVVNRSTNPPTIYNGIRQIMLQKIYEKLLLNVLRTLIKCYILIILKQKGDLKNAP